MDEVRARGTRRWRVVGVVLALLVAGVVVAGIAAYRFVDLSVECPLQPTEDELSAQEAFVRAHLKDVRDVERETLDCDDRSRGGFVLFTTALTPAAARAAFLADRACSEESGTAVTCTSAGVPVYVHFEAGDARTKGRLSMD